MTSSIANLPDDTFALLEAIASPAALCDASGRFVAYNPSFVLHLSTSSASLLGQHIEDVWHSSDKKALRTYLDQLVDNDAVQAGIISANLTLHPVQTASGRLLLVQAAPQDQFDRLLGLFFYQLDLAYWEYSIPDGHFTVSDSWRAIHGYDPQDDIDTLSKDWKKDVHPDDLEHLQTSISVLISGHKKTVEIQYRRKHLMTHKWLWIMSRSTVVEYDENGTPVRIVGIDNDITEIKRSEADREQLNEKIDLAIEASGIGIWEFDSTKSRVHWDDRLLAIYGLEPGNNDQSGDFWAKHIHPEDREATVAFAAECARTKADLVCDFRIVRPDGEVRHIRTMARYLDPTVKHTKLFGVNIDVTADVLHAQELERARKQLEFDSRHDALTGLANRRLLDETLAKLSNKIDDDQEIAVMHLDLDHFKKINDTLGHAAGDAVLVHVAQIFMRIVGEHGVIFRMGGDEFAVLFEQAPLQQDLDNMAEQIIKTLKMSFKHQGHACHFSVSIGAAKGRGRAAIDNNIFGKADVALYAAKGAGRSCFRMYSVRRHASNPTDLKRRQDVLDAIAEGTIEMWYQPQYDTKTLNMVGVEALARIDHPVMGLLLPEDFLPLAKEAGLLSQIEEMILKCVLADQTQWASAGLNYPRVSINISPDRLTSPLMIDQIKANMEPHHAIAFELLETTFLDEPGEKVLANLAQLRSLEIPIELDDFGSGHASIIALRSIRPETVKIDKQVVKDISWSNEALSILRSVITIARALNTRIVLEGIENSQLKDTALTLDCDVLQGFDLCKPLSHDDFSAMLASASN